MNFVLKYDGKQSLSMVQIINRLEKNNSIWIMPLVTNGILICSIFFFDYDLVYGDEAFSR
jgi:hypothetical protein